MPENPDVFSGEMGGGWAGWAGVAGVTGAAGGCMPKLMRGPAGLLGGGAGSGPPGLRTQCL
jgi:hypothetical protein